jgi:hypothetical protein
VEHVVTVRLQAVVVQHLGDGEAGFDVSDLHGQCVCVCEGYN